MVGVEHFSKRQIKLPIMTPFLFLSLSLRSPVGFAVNLIRILANPNARFVLQGAKSGMQENAFLNKLTKLEDLEPKANNCTKVRLTVPLCDILPYRFITTAYLLLCVRSLCLSSDLQRRKIV